MKKMLFERQSEGFDLKYFMTEQEMISEEGTENIYGIIVEMFEEGLLKEREDTGFITRDLAYIESLIETLANNTTPPSAVSEIVDEILDCSRV
ncbi:MAG: DUF6514 family protein [Defluviitaleaceae bacterium]|nr:DUF6514 family protein [Defluviitaleaceae bacterium]